MPGTNYFLKFATGGGANVLSDASYAALAALATGFQSGTAKSIELNKVWRQSGFVAHCVAQLIPDELGVDAPDDGNDTTFVAHLKSAIQTLSWVNAALSGNPTAPTQGNGDSSTKIASTAFVHNLLGTLATVASTGLYSDLIGKPSLPTTPVQYSLGAYNGDQSYVIAHNLGADPQKIRVRVNLVCTVNDWSYTVGQVIHYGSSTQPDNTNGMLTCFSEANGNTTTVRINSHLNAVVSPSDNKALAANKWAVYASVYVEP